MTSINPYGIGAGRAIAEQYEDGPEKVRKESRRRETAAQAADRERLKARLQQRLPDFAESQELRSKRVGVADTDRPARKPPVESEKSFKDLLLEEERGVDASQGTRQHRPFPPGFEAPELRSVDQASQQHEASLSEAGLLGALLSDIRSAPGKLTRERVLSKLDTLRESLRSCRPDELPQEERDGVLGYLEFLDGYFDAPLKNGGQSEQIASLMEDIRVQLKLAVDPAKAASMQQMAVANRMVESGGRPKSASSAAPGDHRKVLHKEKLRGSDEGDEADAAILMQEAASASIAPPVAIHGAGSQGSQSSLGKDSDRRRDETIVSVTMRSV